MKQDSKYYTAQTLYKEGQHPSKVKYAIEQYLKENYPLTTTLLQSPLLGSVLAVILVLPYFDIYPVLYSREGVFSGMDFIESVQIPYTVLEIREAAFYDCVNLLDVKSFISLPPEN